jgi:hypothetical protein
MPKRGSAGWLDAVERDDDVGEGEDRADRQAMWVCERGERRR